MIIVIRWNIDKVSGFSDIILGDICYRMRRMRRIRWNFVKKQKRMRRMR